MTKLNIEESVQFAADAAKSVLDIAVANIREATGRRVIMTVSISVDPEADAHDGPGNTCVISNVNEMVVASMMSDYIEQVLTDRLIVAMHQAAQPS